MTTTEKVLKEKLEEIPVQTPQRFQTTDLSDKGLWMAKRIIERWPHLQTRFVLSWLGGTTAQNEYWFVHTKNAVLLAQRFIEELNQHPSVRIWFVFARDKENTDHITECADLYSAAVRWAIEIGAMRVVNLDKFTDVKTPLIKQELGGKLQSENCLFVKTR